MDTKINEAIDKVHFRRMTTVEIVEIVAATVPSAVREFEIISTISAHRVPEYWITCSIARALAHSGMQVVPEAPIKIFSNDIGSPMSLSGKVDLAVYDQAPFPDDADLRCIIEIKGCKSAWTDFHKDCGRIRQILSETEGKVEFGLFVYVSGLMNSAALKDDFSRFYEITGFDESMVSKIGPYQALRTDQQDCWWQGLVARFGELKGDSVAVVEESLYKD